MGAGHLLVLQGRFRRPGRVQVFGGHEGFSQIFPFLPQAQRDGGQKVRAPIFLSPALLELNPCELRKQIKG